MFVKRNKFERAFALSLDICIILIKLKKMIRSHRWKWRLGS